MLAYEDYSKQKKRRGNFRNTTKEERAEILGNVICPRCGYQNHIFYVKKYGTCHLCGVTLDNNYFKKMIYRRLYENRRTNEI